ncbi:MAG: DUF885 domain-containing protein [Chlorobi bacterium]|nr:DUF885 domain-containing protein [Chlorobiota bacterium]
MPTELENKFTELYAEAFPQQALSQGYWQAVQLRIIPDQHRFDRVNKFISWAKSIPLDDSLDVLMLKHEAQLLEVVWTRWKPWTYDPSYFNFADGLSWFLIHSPHVSEEKLSIATDYIKQIPDYIEAIKTHLDVPTKEHLQLAIEQNIGAVRFIDSILDSLFKDVSRDHKFFDAWDRARDSVSQFVEWLHRILKTTKEFRSYRVPEEIYYDLWQYAVSKNISPDEAYNSAHEFISLLRMDMMDKLSQISGKQISERDIARVLRKYSEQNMFPAENWLPSLIDQLSELRGFIESKEFISLDGLPSLVVRPTPEYMRGGGAGASITAPGPFDQNPVFYYNVDPIETYPESLRDSILREYNAKTLFILNAHEAYPGHYVQLAYALKYAGIIPNVLGNTGFIEGWAVFSEKLLLDSGFHEDDLLLRAFHDKWLIRVAANTIVDFETHIKGTDIKSMLDFLINTCFQEEAEAIDKWKRARLSVVQLSSYFTGFMQMNRLFEVWKQRNGGDVRQFVSWLLPQGSPPFHVLFQRLEKK